MFCRKKRKGVTLAYVIVVLAIIATIGTAIVSLSLANYKAMIVHGKKTQNLYMSEAGLDKVQKALDIITAKAITYANDVVAKNDAILYSDEDLETDSDSEGYQKIASKSEESQNKIFKEAYEKSIIDQLTPSNGVDSDKKVFLLEDDKVIFNNDLIKLSKTEENEKNEEGNYDIALININNKEVKDTSDFIDNLNFNNVSNKDDERDLSFRLNSKFNVKESDGTKNYKDVALTFTINVPDYNGVYQIGQFPLYNACSNGLVVGDNLNVDTGSTLNVDGGVFVSANTVKNKDDLITGNINNSKSGNGVVINGGTLNVNNGWLVSKNDIRLGGSGSKLNVGLAIQGEIPSNKSNTNENNENDGFNEKEKLGIYTGSLGINGDNIGFDKNVNDGHITSEYPVYAMNDLILNGEKSTIYLKGGFYGLNSNRTTTETGKINNSSAIIVNTYDIGIANCSSINIDKEAVIMGTAYINTKPEAYQTGESVSVKGNYIAYTVDNGSVVFKYYNPLQLAELDTVDAKAKYFKDYIKEAKGKTYLKGITLPTNTTSIGATISGENVQLNNNTLDKTAKIRIDQVNDYEKAIDYIGSLITNQNGSTAEINFPNEKIENIADIKEDDGKISKSIIYIDSKDTKSGTLTIKAGSTTTVSDDEIILGNGSGSGIIITNKNVVLDSSSGSLNLNGTIITTANLSINKDSKVNIIYDEGVIRKIISQNYSYFKDLFNGEIYKHFITIKSQTNMSDNTLNLVKASNWEVN